MPGSLPKSQIPGSKSQVKPNDQISNAKSVAVVLDFGRFEICLGIGICDLGFRACALPSMEPGAWGLENSASCWRTVRTPVPQSCAVLSHFECSRNCLYSRLNPHRQGFRCGRPTAARPVLKTRSSRSLPGGFQVVVRRARRNERKPKGIINLWLKF